MLTLPRSTAAIERSVEINTPLIAPLASGDVVGQIVLSRAGERVAEIPLEVMDPVASAGFFARLWDSIVLWFQQVFG